MRLFQLYFFAVWFIVCSFQLPAAEQSTRVVTDAVGRKVTIPTKINRVYSTGPVGTILLYTLVPEKLVGWNYKHSEPDVKYIVPPYDKLPVVGGWYGKSNTGNLEEIINARPDLIVSVGMTTTDTLSIATGEQVQMQSGIPVYMAESDLFKLEQTYRTLGDVLGVPERGRELADYCAQTFQDVQEKMKKLPPRNKRARVYYAEGFKGLETDASGSPHSALLDWVGAVNVADTPLLDGYGRAQVSREQLLRWNPDIIIAGYEIGAGPGGVYNVVKNDPTWQHLAAVKNGKVYETPQHPFNWFDRPPSVSRVLGVKWVANLLYPDIFPYDMRHEASVFYEKFYHKKLTEAELDGLLNRSLPQK
jgi:iron complex transport system substrate-binding protein